MKKVLFSLLVVFVLVWNTDTVFAKGGSRGGGQEKRAKAVEKKAKPDKERDGEQERGEKDEQKNQDKDKKKKKERPEAAGNVGIGTTTPKSPLYVAGVVGFGAFGASTPGEGSGQPQTDSQFDIINANGSPQVLLRFRLNAFDNLMPIQDVANSFGGIQPNDDVNGGVRAYGIANCAQAWRQEAIVSTAVTGSGVTDSAPQTIQSWIRDLGKSDQVDALGDTANILAIMNGTNNRILVKGNGDLLSWGGLFSKSVSVETNVGIGTTAPGASLHVAAENNNYDGTIKLGARAWLQHRDAGQTVTSLINDYNNDSAKLDFRMKGTAAGNAVMTILGSGNVGIGTTVPARKLHVNDVMRLQPRATAPSNPAEGDIYMDSTTHKLMVYDGTTWQACW